jgi:N-acetylglutamate synthase-like GNAT family acetyltransferase
MPPALRRATAHDLSFVLELQRRFTAQLGFLPTAAITRYVEQTRVMIGTENDEPAGYLLGNTYLRYQPLIRPITQAAIALDAQRRHLGLRLVAQTVADATAAGQTAVQACCAEGLAANDFWLAAGFRPICYLRPDNTRQRSIICWRKILTAKIPTWIIDPPRIAGYRAARTNPE